MGFVPYQCKRREAFCPEKGAELLDYSCPLNSKVLITAAKSTGCLGGQSASQRSEMAFSSSGKIGITLENIDFLPDSPPLSRRSGYNSTFPNRKKFSLLRYPVAPMLACSSAPFNSEDHVFEIKFDGMRCILFVEDGRVRLQSRGLLDVTHRYPELAGIADHIHADMAILDGELIIPSGGKSDFYKLQQRWFLDDPRRIKRAAVEMPAMYVAFDVLEMDGGPLVSLPLIERKAHLSELVTDSAEIVWSRPIEGHGRTYFAEAVKNGLEGVMAKRKCGRYLPGKRSRDWLKVKTRHEAECYVVGYKSDSSGVSELLVAEFQGGHWTYRGAVELGFNAVIGRLFRSLPGKPYPFLSQSKRVRWIMPMQCRVSHHEITPSGLFRIPVFRGLFDAGCR